MIDATQGTIKTKQLVDYVTFVLTAGTLSILVSLLRGTVQEKINLGVRIKLWNKLMRLPTRFYDEDGGGSLVTRVTTDVDMAHYYFTLLLSIVTSIYAAIVAFLKLYEFQADLAVYMLLIFPFTFFVGIFYCKFTGYAGNLTKLRLADTMGYLHEHVQNFRLIKAVRTERAEEEKADRLFDRQFKSDVLMQASTSLTVVAIEILSCITTAISFIVGGKMVMEGTLTVGRLIGVYTLAGMVSLRFAQLFTMAGSFSQYNGALNRVAEVLETSDEPQGGVALHTGCQDISLENLNFSYGGVPVIRDMSCLIPKGKVTAVIGPNGAGKSTLFKLLERLYSPESGVILSGDTDISAFSLDSWRKAFAIVAQDKPLMSGTIRENILYGVDRHVEEDELVAVAKAAGIYDFVMAAPGGFDAEVGPGGGNLSGGQQQCIAIARAMMRDPDYLLLDEATSNLDVKSERAVSDALYQLMKGRTTVMIAHSYAATLSADNVLVMQDGKIKAAGTPEELLKTNDYYRIFARTGTDAMERDATT